MNPKADHGAARGRQENTPWASLYKASLPGRPSILLVIGLGLCGHPAGMIPVRHRQELCRRGSALDALVINLGSASASQNRKSARPNLSIWMGTIAPPPVNCGDVGEASRQVRRRRSACPKNSSHRVEPTRRLPVSPTSGRSARPEDCARVTLPCVGHSRWRCEVLRAVMRSCRRPPCGHARSTLSPTPTVHWLARGISLLLRSGV